MNSKTSKRFSRMALTFRQPIGHRYDSSSGGWLRQSLRAGGAACGPADHDHGGLFQPGQLQSLLVWRIGARKAGLVLGNVWCQRRVYGGSRTSCGLDTFPRHRRYRTDVTDWASYFMQRSRETGGQGSATGFAFEEMAMAWFGRNLALPEEDQAAKFYRTACTKMRYYNGLVGAGDGGPAYLDSSEGSIHSEVNRMLYEFCKQDQFTMCYSPIVQFAIDGGVEFDACTRSKPECLKEREVCLGRCGGKLMEIRQTLPRLSARRSWVSRC